MCFFGVFDVFGDFGILGLRCFWVFVWAFGVCWGFGGVFEVFGFSFGFWVVGFRAFGFRAFGFRVFGFRVSGSLGLRFRIQGSGFSRFRALGLGFRVLGFRT